MNICTVKKKTTKNTTTQPSPHNALDSRKFFSSKIEIHEKIINSLLQEKHPDRE